MRVNKPIKNVSRQNLDNVLEHHNSLYTGIPAEKTDFKIGHFCNFLTYVTMTLDLRRMAYCHVALIDLYLHTKFCSNWNNFLWTDVHADIETDQLY